MSLELEADLRQRLQTLTKLAPAKQPAVASLAPLYPEQGFALPTRSLPREASLASLASLADPCLLPDLCTFTWEEAAFIDTETTGLSTGVGTYVVLLGIGSLVDGEFSVRQYFLPDPAVEPQFWEQVLADLTKYQLLCTFNGRSYDLPLINNRLLLNGLPGLQPLVHLDLLHPARRLWRKILPSCALQSLEEHRLDHKRVDDLPGALIPGIYYDYLQSGDRQALQPVFEHNWRDIVSLFELTAQLAESCALPEQRLQRAEEFFGLADAYLRTGQAEPARELISAGLERPGGERVKRQYLAQLAKLEARAGRYAQAIAAWQQLAHLEVLSPEPQIELAKLYEHRLRDFELATFATEQALAICRRRAKLGVPLPAAAEAMFKKRLERLARRLGRQPAGDKGGIV